MPLRFRFMTCSLALLMFQTVPALADDMGGLALEQAVQSHEGLGAGTPSQVPLISIDPVERAQFTVDVFRATCYDDFFDQQKIRDWASASLTSISGTPKQVALSVVHADSGDVWSAKLPGGSHYGGGKSSGGEIALVLEPGGRCHVLSFGADTKAVHEAMGDFERQLRKTLPDKEIDYKYNKANTERSFDESMIGIISPLNNPDARDPTMVILADTAPGGLNDITASISIFSNFDPDAGTGAANVAAVSGPAADKAVLASQGVKPAEEVASNVPLMQTVPLKVSSYTTTAIPLNVPSAPPVKAAAVSVPAKKTITVKTSVQSAEAKTEVKIEPKTKIATTAKTAVTSPKQVAILTKSTATAVPILQDMPAVAPAPVTPVIREKAMSASNDAGLLPMPGE